MRERPVLYCLVARISADGWVALLTREKQPLLTLAEACEIRDGMTDVAILIDPMDEIALGNFERENLPFNRPKRVWPPWSAE
jgi:hypothetical protein